MSILVYLAQSFLGNRSWLLRLALCYLLFLRLRLTGKIIMEIDEKGSFCRHCVGVMINDKDGKPFKLYCSKYGYHWMDKEFCEKCTIPKIEMVAIKLFNS